MSRGMVFSCPMPLGSPGPSRPLTRLHKAFQSHFPEYRCIEPSEFPQLKDTNGLGHAIGPAFDDVALDHLKNNACDVFLGGGGASLRQMEHLASKGAVCGTTWFSSHWKHAQGILAEEYAKFGNTAPSIHPYVAWRAQVEQTRSHFMIVPSEYCKNTYPSSMQDRIHVAEFGVDTEAFQAAPKRLSERLNVLFPATNPPRKGLLYALDAWTGLKPDKFLLTITGSPIGNNTGPMTLLGRDGKRLDHAPVTSHGWVTDADMRNLYAGSDVLLLPSLEEGQALASLEAAACGLPLIVTPEVGLPITDGKEGFIVPSRNPKAIRDALQTLQEDEALYHRMSKAARLFAEARPWSFFTDRVTSILEEVHA